MTRLMSTTHVKDEMRMKSNHFYYSHYWNWFIGIDNQNIKLEQLNKVEV